MEIERWLDDGFKGFNMLWDDQTGVYKCQDHITGKLANAATSAAFLPLFAGNRGHGAALVSFMQLFQSTACSTRSSYIVLNSHLLYVKKQLLVVLALLLL